MLPEQHCYSKQICHNGPFRRPLEKGSHRGLLNFVLYVAPEGRILVRDILVLVYDGSMIFC
jgi:hypothetical protein